MRRRQLARDPEARLEMTPMIDVTFLLLVFFLCTLRFRSLEGKLAAYLPPDAGAAATAADLVERIEVRVAVAAPGERVDPASGAAWDGAGPLAWRGRRLAYRVGPRAVADLDALRAHLADLAAADPDRPVAIHALAGTLHGDVVPVLDAVALAGFDEVAFAAAP